MLKLRNLLPVLLIAGGSACAAPVQAQRVTKATTVDVRSFGAKGDGRTDDAAAFAAAQAAVTRVGGGTIRVPRSAAGYVIGDTTRKGTGIYPTTRTVWEGDDALLIHRARNAENQPRLFTITDAEDVTVRGLRIAGEGRAAMAISLTGVLRNVTVERLELYDFKNFAMTYGGKDTDARTARFDNLVFRNIRIHGIVGRVGDGSGINIFPRSQDGDRPASHGVVMTDLDIDVTQGSSRARDHGPQGLKFNNVTGVRLENVRVRGGNIAGITFANGTRDVIAKNITIEMANRGININQRHNVNDTDTQNIEVQGLKYVSAGLARAERSGVFIWGDPPGLAFSGLDLEGDFLVRAEAANDRLTGLQVRDLTLRGGRFVVEDSKQPTAPVEGLRISGLRILGAATGGSPRVQLGGVNRSVSGSVIDSVEIENGRHGDIALFGDDNAIEGVADDVVRIGKGQGNRIGKGEKR